MAEDDFAVIACIILSYLHASLKRGEKVNSDYINPDYFHTNRMYFDFIMAQLHDAGYITGCYTERWKDGSCVILTDDLCITLAGIEYLECNGMMAKAKRAIPEMRGRGGTLLELLQIGAYLSR